MFSVKLHARERLVYVSANEKNNSTHMETKSRNSQTC